jgi:hypothetical protein
MSEKHTRKIGLNLKGVIFWDATPCNLVDRLKNTNKSNSTRALKNMNMFQNSKKRDTCLPMFMAKE